jgi:hypothetical protein
MKKLLMFVSVVVIFSCNKSGYEVLHHETELAKVKQVTQTQSDVEACHAEQAARNYKGLAMRSTERGKPIKDPRPPKPPKNNPDTPPPPPPPPPTEGGDTTSVIFIDFDGHYMATSSWSASPLDLTGSGLTLTQQQAIVDSAKHDWKDFRVKITTDEAAFLAANPYKRIRCVVTQSHEWYGMYGGVAFVNSFTSGGNNPCFVFSRALNYVTKHISDVISHEVGHTFGNRHQSVCVNGVKEQEYRPGVIMGTPYGFASVDWIIGTSAISCATQDDRAMIASKL